MELKRGFWFSTLIILGVFSFSAMGELDSTRYIPVEQVKPGMEAYCLTVLEGTKIERFTAKVLSIVHNSEPGKSRILVLVDDDRFRHIGAVHGCSGSPVYIDGRMAGALAAGWDGSLDPLYLVTPIEDMLEVNKLPAGIEPVSMKIDFASLLNPEKINQQYTQYLQSHYTENKINLPLAVSFPVSVCSQMGPEMQALGLVPISSASGMDSSRTSQAGEFSSFSPGGVLAIPLCSGDLSLAATGTVTEVDGDKVYGFGHSFLGYGQVNMPIASGYVHSVVASRMMSFKFSSPGPPIGTLTFDRNSAVAGLIGQVPSQIPLKIRMNRFDDLQQREYNCQLAINRVLTPLILRMAVLASGETYGPFPPEHHLNYEIKMNLKDHVPIHFSNVSSGRGMLYPSSEASLLLMTMMLNQFEPVEVTSIEVAATVEPKLSAAEVREVRLSGLKVKAGQTITAQVTLEAHRRRHTVHEISLKIPETLPPGTYPLQLLSRDEYISFLQKAAMHRFTPDNVDSMLQTLRQLMSIPRNRLYAVLSLPAGGIIFHGKELPDLPNSHMLLLQDTRRMMPKTLFKRWTQSSIDLDMVPSGALTIPLTVEP